MKKPKFLYHGTSVNDLDELSPFSKSKPADFQEGDVVFATPDYVGAIKFMIPWNDSWAHGGSFSKVHYLVVSDENKFLSMDHGGTVYILPVDTFTHMSGGEWFSKVSVKPIKKQYFSSVLDAMMENEIQVFFVDKKTFDEVNNSDDHGYSILKELTSENQKRGVGIRNF